MMDAVYPMPLLGARIPQVTSGYGYRGSQWHPGVDIFYRRVAGEPTLPPAAMGDWIVPAGTPALAYRPGVVSIATQIGTGGEVRVQHGDHDSLSLHLRTISVRPGQRVKTGQVLGFVGDDLKNPYDGDHLHFEIRVNNVPVDPAPYINGLPKIQKPFNWGLLLAVGAIGLVWWRMR